MQVTAIVVTFNRAKELERCIRAVMKQSYKIQNLVIVNNASTDNTLDTLKDIFETDISTSLNRTIFVREVNDIKVYIYNFSENTGGSGGFSKGMEISHKELASDYYWMMDDDGYPTSDCLSILMKSIDNYDYVMPVSINVDKNDELSWPVRKKNGVKTVIYKELRDSWGNVMNFVTPFNGVLLSKRCVDTVGYINKDFFIWGDEYEHWWRCKENNINPVTIMDALFYHPAAKLPLVLICFGLFKVPYVNSELRMCCLARNYTYIYLHHDKKIKIAIKYLMYWWLFIITRHFDVKGWKLYKSSVKDGLKGNFTRHFKYLK